MSKPKRQTLFPSIVFANWKWVLLKLDITLVVVALLPSPGCAVCYLNLGTYCTYRGRTFPTARYGRTISYHRIHAPSTKRPWRRLFLEPGATKRIPQKTEKSWVLDNSSRRAGSAIWHLSPWHPFMRLRFSMANCVGAGVWLVTSHPLWTYFPATVIKLGPRLFDRNCLYLQCGNACIISSQSQFLSAFSFLAVSAQPYLWRILLIFPHFLGHPNMMIHLPCSLRPLKTDESVSTGK